MSDYQTIHVEHSDSIGKITLKRPEKANALNWDSWKELKQAFEWAHETPEVRVVILQGEGKHFCAGIDLEDFASLFSKQVACDGRKREQLRELILNLQSTFNAIEKCSKPVIAAVHGGCIGGGLDMIAACDMRFCTDDAYFVIKEIDLGMTADLGSLQRLGHLIPQGILRELAYTGRRFDGIEAQALGLVNRVFLDEAMQQERVLEIAKAIASKSPLSIRGSKEMLLYARDHSVSDSLNYVAIWNAAMLLSSDLVEANQATFEKRAATFDD